MIAHPATPARRRGFSLVEVMVALIIICVGLLGIAKLEALVLSSTGTSRVRALIALEASSLAASMHANRVYWSGSSTYWNPTSDGDLSISGTPTSATNTTYSPADAPSALQSSIGSAVCAETSPGATITACDSQDMAGYDLQQWYDNLGALVPNSTASVSCSPVNTVVTCNITISWTENTVAANSQEAAQGAPSAFQNQTYTLVVEP
jgi:type IV pilus assembly protein PilV